MIRLGHIQTLEVVNIVVFGVYLNETESSQLASFFVKSDDILLPKSKVPEGAAIGDLIEVFVHKDSEDRIIATTDVPKATYGEMAVLEVVDSIPAGAFMDWGLGKDLFLPEREQVGEVVKGGKYLVRVYTDSTERLCASMDIYNHLHSEHEYKRDDVVKGTIYDIKDHMGALVAVDNKYHGLIPIRELFGDYEVSKEITCRVVEVRDDGKLDLAIRQTAYIQMDDDSELILGKLRSNDGVLAFNDKSSPEAIKNEFKLSKKAFKRATGKLYKERKIIFTDNGIELTQAGMKPKETETQSTDSE